MKLNEIKTPISDGIAWISRSLTIENGSSTHDVVPNVSKGTFTLHGEVTLHVSEFKVEIGKVWGDFFVDKKIAPHIKSLIGFPREIGGHLFLNGCINLKSFVGIPNCIYIDACNTGISDVKDVFPHLNFNVEILHLADSKIISLIGIADTVKHKIETLVLNTEKSDYEGGLGLLNIPGLKYLDLQINLSKMSTPFKIIQKYLGRPDDIFECQEELIKAGFENMAQL